MPMIAKTCRDNLAALVRAYRAGTGASMSAVSKKFYGNGGFLPSYLAGAQSMSIEKYEAVVEKIKLNWPVNTAWPATRAIVMHRPDMALAARTQVAAAEAKALKMSKTSRSLKKAVSATAAAAALARQKSFPQKNR